MKNDFGSSTQPLPIVQSRFPWLLALGLASLGATARACLLFNTPLAVSMNAALPPLIAIPVFALAWRWSVRAGAGLWVPICAALAAAIGAPALLMAGDLQKHSVGLVWPAALLVASVSALTAVWFRRKSLTTGNIAVVTGCALGSLALSGPSMSGDNALRFRLIVIGLALICASFALLQVRLPRARNILATFVVLALVVPGAIRVEGLSTSNLAAGSLSTSNLAAGSMATGNLPAATSRTSPPEHFHHRPCTLSESRKTDFGTATPMERKARRVESWI